MPATQEMNDILAKIIQLGPQQGPSNSSLARQMLLGASANFGDTKGGESDASPSLVSRIFDILSRPNYAVANIAQNTLKNLQEDSSDGLDVGEALGSFSPLTQKGGLEAAWRGISGQDKTTFQNVLQNAGMGDGFGTAALGFGLDIALDPTTYIGAGAVKSVGKGVLKALGKTTKEAEKAATAATKPELLGRLTVNEGPTAPRILENLPQPGDLNLPERPVGSVPVSVPGQKVIPKQLQWMKSPQAVAGVERAAEAATPGEGYKKAFSTFMQEAKKSKGPQPKKRDYPNIQAYAKAVSDWKAGKNAPVVPTPPPVHSASDLVDQIASGDLQAAYRVSPKPPSTPPASAGETSVGIDVARKFLRNAKLPDKNLNPAQQLRVLKNLWNKASGDPVERIAQTQRMLRESEKYFRSQGYNMKYWDGMHVKLSDLIDEMGGPTRVSMNGFMRLLGKGEPDPLVDGAVEALRARSAMDDTSMVKLGLDQVAKRLSAADQVMSPTKLADYRGEVQKEFEQAMKAADVSPGSIRASQQVVKQLADGMTNAAQNAIDTKSTTLVKVVSGVQPAAWQNVNKAITHQIDLTLGINSRVAGTKIGNGAKAFESVASRINTAYGMPDIRPTQLDYVLSAEANAERRHRLWRPILRSTDEAQRRDAWNIARGAVTATSPEQQKLADLIYDQFTQLFFSSGIHSKTNTVALRSGLMMKDLNAELKRAGSEFYFDNTGKYAKDIQWLGSWQDWEIKGDPVEALTKVETAVERLVKKYALFDDVSARWGARAPGGEYRYTIDHPRFKGVYFPKDMVGQLQTMMNHLDNMYEPKSPLAKYFDEVLSIWKTYVTIYSPSHHIRNAIGDAWLSWIAGVNNPDSYRKAAKIMHAQRGRYNTLPGVMQLVGHDAQGFVNAKGGRTLLTTKGGIPLTSDQIYVAAHRHGLLLAARQIEDIFGEPLVRGKIQPFGGRVHDFVAGVSQNREHYFRLAHFVDALKKTKTKNLEDAFDEAAHVVRKWHPDGMDLTGFERKYMRRIFPFYSWTRKAIPLVLESIVMKPGKVLAYPKGMEALQVAMGIESPSRTDPFPTDQLFPSWIREKGIGPIGLSGSGGATGLIGDLARQGVDSRSGYELGGYALLNPSNPMIDTVAQMFGSNPLQTGIENANPLIRIPIEVGMNSNAATGAPIYGTQYSDPARYVTEQLPILAQISRLTNVGLTGTTGRGEREGVGNLESLINLLTAAGLLGTGPFIKQAEFERKSGMS